MMKKKNIFNFLFNFFAYILAVGFIYFTFYSQIPMLQRRTLFFALLFFGYFYLWNSYRSSFRLFQGIVGKSRNEILKNSLFIILYWLPFSWMMMLYLILNIAGLEKLIGTVFFTFLGIGQALVICVFVVFLPVVFYDLTTFFIKHIKVKNALSTSQITDKRKRILKYLWIPFLCLILISAWGMIWGSANLKIHQVELVSHHPAFKENSLKIVHISDLHVSSFNKIEDLDQIVSTINAQKPDIVFFTGDLAHYSAKEVIDYLPVLKRINSKFGVFSVLGNHDYARYYPYKNESLRLADVQKLKYYQESIGWTVLTNENLKIPLLHDSDSLVIAGIDYWNNDRMFINEGNVEATFSGIQDSSYVIFMSHNPKIWKYLKKKNLHANLTLSGHTHGMQVGWMTECCRWSPASLIYKEWGGLYKNPEKEEQYLYVNVGLATVSIPFRIGVYPEITVITIHYKK